MFSFASSPGFLAAGRSRRIRCPPKRSPGRTEVCLQPWIKYPAPVKKEYVSSPIICKGVSCWNNKSFLNVFFFSPPGFSVPEQKNPLLQLKQSGAGTGTGRVKRRYKRKNTVSPVKKGPSPVKRRQMTTSPTKILLPPVNSRELMSTVKVSQWRVSFMDGCCDSM